MKALLALGDVRGERQACVDVRDSKSPNFVELTCIVTRDYELKKCLLLNSMIANNHPDSFRLEHEHDVIRHFI